MASEPPAGTYIECIPVQEAAYWEARRQRMGLDDFKVGSLLRAAAVHIRAQCRIETLEELATLADAGIEINGDALRELRTECEAATTPIGDVQ